MTETNYVKERKINMENKKKLTREKEKKTNLFIIKRNYWIDRKKFQKKLPWERKKERKKERNYRVEKKIFQEKKKERKKERPRMEVEKKFLEW